MVRRSMCMLLLSALVLAVCVTPEIPGGETTSRPLRAGLIGLDTSHVIAFTGVLNDPDAKGDLADVRVVAGYPGGTDIPSSRNRVEGYTKKLRAQGIEMVDSIPALLEKVDVVLLESVDGNPHLEQVIPVFEAGKPVFIDKPLAGSLSDAIVIYQLGKRHNVPWFSSSSLRFSPGIIGMRGTSDETGKVTGCSAWSPCSLEPTHPDLFWYGVHGVEILFTIMGQGCEQVTRVQTEGSELVTGVWTGGRIGTFRGIRAGRGGYGAMVFGEKGIAPAGNYAGYEPLLEEIARFFKTGKPPVSHEETLELFAFMEAADESKRRGGCPVRIEEVMKKARAEAMEKMQKIAR